MNTQQLESFLAVAENLNFARAAENLNITQSAVSRQIHSLEEELDTKLFHRTSRSVAFTPSGISFYEDAKNIMNLLHVATAKIQRHAKSSIQILSIGCSNEVDCGLLTDLLEKCRNQFPALHPDLRVIPHRSIQGLFFQGDLDVLFGYQEDVPVREGVAYKELFQVPICCAVSASHRYSHKKELHMQELLSESLIICNSYAIPSKAVNLRNRIEQHFPLDAVYYCDNLNALLTLVKAGYGLAILPRLDITGPRICYIPIKEEASLSYGIFYKENDKNPFVKDFISLAALPPKTCL